MGMGMCMGMCMGKGMGMGKETGLGMGNWQWAMGNVQPAMDMGHFNGLLYIKIVPWKRSDYIK
jgi:hypothetical protein